MFGDKTESDMIAGYASKEAKYKKKKAKFEKDKVKFEKGRGHGVACYSIESSYSPDESLARRSMENAKKEMDSAKAARDAAARQMVANRVLDGKRNTIVLYNDKPETRREKVYNPATGRDRYVEVNARSGRVTDRQLELSKRRVYGKDVPKGNDTGTPARVTYRAHPNARQMVYWENHPDRSDIIGIDAPEGAIASTGEYIGVPKVVRDQFGIESRSPKAKKPEIRREKVYNPATGRDRYVEVNARSGRVTDRQLELSKRRVYGKDVPKGNDTGTPARVTYRAHPNARQMVYWENHPDRSDIIGIDAPEGAIASTGEYVGVPKVVRDQFGIESRSPKAKKAKRRC